MILQNSSDPKFGPIGSEFGVTGYEFIASDHEFVVCTTCPYCLMKAFILELDLEASDRQISGYFSQVKKLDQTKLK